jgi:hypothetical protein
VNLQLYWHTTAPSYAPLAHIPENRIYVSANRADAFVHAWLKFSDGKVIGDDKVPGSVIGQNGKTIRRIRIESKFGKMLIYVTDGHLPWPYGAETTGYEVDNLDATITKAKALGATVLTDLGLYGGRSSAMVKFPGGYIAEIHAPYRK